MKTFARIKRFGIRLAVATMILFNRYEAGVRWGTGRSWIPAFLQDQRFDADSATREEIVRKSRYFERNSGLVNRLTDIFEQFTVGAEGLQLIPASSDEEWNGRSKIAWDGWCKFPDLTSLQTFSTLQSLVSRSWFIDGEIFILKTRGKETTIGAGGATLVVNRPRIQLIESHRVATPPDKYTEEGRNIVDGVQIDERGRPIGYWVRIGPLEDERFKFVPAEQMIHVFEPSRVGQYRGLPFSYAVLNDLHDLDDLQLMEMRAARDATEKSTFINTPAGELNTAGSLAQRFSENRNQNSAGVETAEQRTKFVRDAVGGRVAALRMGEKVEQFVSQRPSVTVQWYWDYLTSKICAGHGISKLLVYPWSMQGTVTRADLDIANAFFRSRSCVLAAAFVEIRNYVIGWHITADVNLADPPADWRAVVVRSPRSVNVDVGRNSAAVLAELEAGTRTYQDVYAELGQDYQQQLRQRAKEAALIRALAKEFGVEPGEIVKAAGEAIAAKLAAEKPEPREAIAA